MVQQKKISAVNYFGGKFTFLDELYALFPKHTHYIDLFCGSMVVTLNKAPSLMDTANDLDGDVFNFFKVLRDSPDELFRVIELTLVSRVEYDMAFPIFEDNISDIERARRFYVRCKMSFQGSGLKQHTGFNACVATSERSLSKNVAKYLSSVKKLPDVVERLKTIQIENQDYEYIVNRYDREGTFFYADPPYELRKRNFKKWYNKEFENDIDHERLADVLGSIKGKAMVSAYESDLYQSIYKDWNFIKLKPKGHSMKKGIKQQECVWLNYEPDFTADLFTV